MTITYPASNVGGGTVQFGSGVTALAAVPNGGVVPTDMMIMVGYMDSDPSGLTDAGDGWRIVETGWDSVNNIGMFVAVCISPRNGAATWLGLTSPLSINYVSITQAYRLTSVHGAAAFGVSMARGSQGMVTAAASSTSMTAPEILQPYQQCLDVLIYGYNTGGTVSSGNTVSGFSKRADAGAASPAFGLVVYERALTGAVQNPQVAMTLAAARTNRAGLRIMIPMVSNQRLPIGRMQGSRKLF